MKRESGKGFVDAYVEQLAAQKISIGAITDYNGVNIEWFEVTAAKASNRGITLFPGAEISFREAKDGLHILAIFSGDTDLRDLNDFLQSLDKDPASPLFDNQGSQRDIELRISLRDAFKELRSRFNCLLILPHPDEPEGICKTLKPEDAAKLLLEMRPDAMEHCSEKEKKRLVSTGVLPPNFWDHLAFVEFSDPKRIDEIGTKCRTNGTLRATYLKLSTTDLDALRLAFHDPETRLSIGGVPSAIHPRIRSLAISGSGFLGNLNISWNDDLNVIIGASGVGKSAIIESLRYALAISPYSDQSYREELVRHALGSGGKVEVILDRPIGEKETRQYRIVRGWGEEPRTFEVGSEGTVPIGPSELLGPSDVPIFFGQREIYAVSGNEQYRLALLDGFIGEEFRKSAESVDEVMESLTANARAVSDMHAKLAKREKYDQQLKRIEHEIEIYKRHVTKKQKEMADLRGLGQYLKNTTNTVKNAFADWTKMSPSLLSQLQTAHRNLLEPQSSYKAVLEEVATVHAILQESLKVVLDDGKTVFEQAIRSLGHLGTRLQKTLRPLEEKVERIEMDAQTKTLDQDRLLKLTEEKTSLATFIAEINGIEDRLKILRQKRQELLERTRECRNRQYELRRGRADAITKALQGRLLLKVEYKGQKGDYKKQLSMLLKGSDVSQDAIDQLVIPEAADGIALAEAVAAGAKEVQKRFGLKPEMADHLVKWLNADNSRLLKLETLIPQDALRVKLRIGDQYRSLEHLSVGQCATAVLLLLFGLEGRVLVIDQPEDYLDDRFVHEEILQILREQKGLKAEGQRRQIIVATNDGTIPVMGDAEIVIPLEARGDHAHVVGRASIDDRSVRELIKTIMEDGEEAFQRRAEKYGGLRPS
jgi:predicted ATPase